MEGAPIVRAVVKWFGGFARGKTTGTLRWQWKKTQMSKNPVSPWFGGPGKMGTSGTGGGRSE